MSISQLTSVSFTCILFLTLLTSVACSTSSSGEPGTDTVNSGVEVKDSTSDASSEIAENDSVTSLDTTQQEEVAIEDIQETGGSEVNPEQIEEDTTAPVDTQQPETTGETETIQLCESNQDCIGDAGGEICNTATGACVICLTHIDCQSNPDGAICNEANVCAHADSCTSTWQCAGNPDGEHCVFFEQRCGECLDHDHCDGGHICSPSFECVQPSDQYCKSITPDKQYAKQNTCVECLETAHCADDDEPFCSDENSCVECLLDAQCTKDKEPLCHPDGYCAECTTNAQCVAAGSKYCMWGRCEECIPDKCPASKPACHDGECVECNSDKDCDTAGDYYCNDHVCQFEAIACTKESHCNDNIVLTECSDTLGHCVQCDSNFIDCWYDWEGFCDDTTGTCVDCLEDDDCLTSGKPVCSLEHKGCIQCITDKDCLDNGNGFLCSDTNLCYGECATDTDCSPALGGPTCDADTATCTNCIDDTDCAGSAAGPKCFNKQHCSECAVDADCADKEHKSCNYGACAPEACTVFNQCALDMVTYICNSFTDNCGGTFSCGMCGVGDCVDNGRDCACPPDGYDASGANNSKGAATNLENGGDNYTDAPDSSLELKGLSVHADGDVDWYTFDVDDGFDVSNPKLTVALTAHMPDQLIDESLYEVTVWFDCGKGNDSLCLTGVDNNELPDIIGCSNNGGGVTPLQVKGSMNCDGMDDSGTIYIRVQKLTRYGRCDTYDLTVNIN